MLNDRAPGHPNTRGFYFVYLLYSMTEHLATPTQGDLLCLLFVLNDRAPGHPNTRGFYFVYFLCSTTEHLATPTQGDFTLFTFCAQRPSTWPLPHKGILLCLLFVLNDRAPGHPNTRGFYFVYFLCSTTEHLATPTQGDLLLFTFCAQRPSTWPPQHKGILLCLPFVLHDRALGHPNTRGFYFVYLLYSMTEHLATPTQGDYTFVYFLCSTTEHLATPTQGDLLCLLFVLNDRALGHPNTRGFTLFTFCAQRPSTWPLPHKGILLCLLFVLNDRALGHPNTRGLYFCLLFVLNDRALGHPNTRGFYFVYFLCSTTEHLATPTQGDFTLYTFCALRPSTWPPPHKGIYFCSLFDVLILLSFSFFFLFF